MKITRNDFKSLGSQNSNGHTHESHENHIKCEMFRAVVAQAKVQIERMSAQELKDSIGVKVIIDIITQNPNDTDELEKGTCWV